MVGRTCAEMVRAGRERKHLSVRQLAPQILKGNGQPITASYITDIEKGRGIPAEVVARNLADVLDLPTNEFLKICRRERDPRGV